VLERFTPEIGVFRAPCNFISTASIEITTRKMIRSIIANWPSSYETMAEGKEELETKHKITITKY
jgi:hypothetical protein